MKMLYSNEIKKCLPILQAMAEDKTVQYLMEQYNKWEDLDSEDDGLNIETLINHPEYYRIKPSPKYRPFKDAEECWSEMLKHQPFGWIKDKKSNIRTQILYLHSHGLDTSYSEATSFGAIFSNFTFADGQPFGVKEEE